jgi:hypothetical protein
VVEYLFGSKKSASSKVTAFIMDPHMNNMIKLAQQKADEFTAAVTTDRR